MWNRASIGSPRTKRPFAVVNSTAARRPSTTGPNFNFSSAAGGGADGSEAGVPFPAR